MIPWGAEIVEGTVGGHPCRQYRPRPQAVAELLAAADDLAEEDFLVQGQRRLTFGAFRRAVAAGSDHLAASGIGPGDRVFLVAPNSPDWVVAFGSIMARGAVAVLGNGWWKEAELTAALDLVDPAVVVADGRRANLGPSRRTLAVADFGATGPGEHDAGVAAVGEDDPAVVIFTSGTTARAKAVRLSQRSVIANLHNLILARSKRTAAAGGPVPPWSVSLCSLPLFHISGVQTLLLALLTGTRLVFTEGRFDPAQIVDVIERERVTTWSAVPTMVSMVLALDGLEERHLATLTDIGVGGAPVSPSLLDGIRNAFPSARARLAKGYGSTEAGGTVTMTGGAPLVERPTTCGRPFPVIEVRIGHPDDEGIGEIRLRSPGVMDGYLGLPPSEQPVDADGWLRTGDLGRLDDDGHLHVTGRLKDIIIRGGENIAPAYVEDRIRRHPDVADVTVVGLPHSTWGEEVAAAVVVRAGSPVTARELAAFAGEGLAAFAVPMRWWIRTEPLPLTDSGKVRKADVVAAWPEAAHPAPC